MSFKSVFSLESGVVDEEEAVVKPGDAALILRKNGTVKAMTFGIDRDRLLGPESEYTEDDHSAIEQGKKLFALMFAAQNPAIMSALMEIASNPTAAVDVNALRVSRLVH